MKGAIFYSSRYGSTEQYANWIGEATGLPVFNIKDVKADPNNYDFLILGSSLILFRLIIRKWVKANFSDLEGRAKILFSVSGAGPGPKIERWVTASLPESLLSKMNHVALRGKMDHSKLSWGMKQFMKMGALFNPDRQASKDERHGFDYMDKSSIEPILELVRQFEHSKVPL